LHLSSVATEEEGPPMDAELVTIDLRQADVIEAGEELLVKAHAVAQRIERRVLKALGRHDLPEPTTPTRPGVPRRRPAPPVPGLLVGRQ
jgi:hypothetical protein